jgi:hypothetical protein
MIREEWGSAVAKETGFLDKHLGWDAKVIVETRFL